MGITNYFRTCGKNVPGNKSRVYFNASKNIDSVTITDNEVTAITTKVVELEAQNFAIVEAEIDGVQWTSEGTGSTSYRSTQNLIMHLNRKTKSLIKLKDELVDVVTCGAVAIRIDSNGHGWLSGYSEKEGLERPYNQIEDNYDTGTELTDEDVQRMTINLGRVSGEDEIPLSSVLVESILDGTATFINFPS